MELDEAYKEVVKKFGKIDGHKIAFALMGSHKNDYPFIKLNHKTDRYHSEIKALNHLVFTSKKEVALLNAIWQNVDGEMSVNDLTHLIPFLWKMLGIESAWTK